MQWVLAGKGVVVAEVMTREQGCYEVWEGIELGQVYVVQINGGVGLPSTVVADTVGKQQDFLGAPLGDPATISGHIDAWDGSALAGTQRYRLWSLVYDTWATDELSTYDCPTHTSPQRQKWSCTVPGGEAYMMWINRGPARTDGGYSDEFAPPEGSSSPCQHQFRRNSGTAGGEVTNHGSADTMQWWRGGVAQTYEFAVLSGSGSYNYVSLPTASGGTTYAIRINGQAAATGSPYKLPRREGAGNDDHDFTKQ